MTKLSSAVSHEGEYAAPSGPTRFKTAEHPHEIRCGMCGEVYFVNSETLEGVTTAIRAGLDNPFMCVDCEEEYDELAYEG